jgi:hypothetical protein
VLQNLYTETLKPAEMKFMKPTAGYSALHLIRNEDISDEHEIDSISKKEAQYKQKCLNHISRTGDVRYPEPVLSIRLPIGR